VQCAQQGDKLSKYRLIDNKFEEARFSIALMTASGELLAGECNNQFTNSLTKSNGVMAPGKYVVMIAPVWNESAFSDPRHTKVYVELLSTLELDIGEISAHDGNRLFESAMIQHARNSPDKKQISNL
jgi:hypothetical protein